MPTSRSKSELRVLLLAPTARDGQASESVMRSAGIDCVILSSMSALCAEIAAGAGAVMVPEEAVNSDVNELLSTAIRRQPVWSDIPVVVLARGGLETPAVARAVQTLGNVSLLERPVRVSTLVSVIRTALRARERQYEMRDHLAVRSEYESALQSARDAAENANRAKDKFLAVLSHELRTPLTPVVMAASLLERTDGLPDHVRESLVMIRRNVDLECRLIDDLLDLSRVISGKLNVKSAPLHVHDVLRSTLQYCTSSMYGKGIRIHEHYQATNDFLHGDVARLQQVFWNLLRNATKFTPEGGQISIRTWNLRDGRLSVQVTDSGVGIPDELLPKIFNAFEQGDSRVTHQFGGLGLGLAIAKAVVDLHGGTIRVSSGGAGKGATFTVELNTVAAKADAPLAPAAAPVAERRKSTRILLVEDHPDTAEVMHGLLTAMGHRVTNANTVASALELAEHDLFDIVISDIGLPDASGYELMNAIKQKHPLPGIALSGYGMDEDVQRSRRAGFADHLVKPVDIIALEAVIRRVLTPA